MNCRRRGSIIAAAVAVLSLVGCGDSDNGQMVQTDVGRAFELGVRPISESEIERFGREALSPYFEPVGKLYLAPEAGLAHISSIEISDGGRILATDRPGRVVGLFGPDGELVEALRGTCLPGVEWQPVTGRFGTNEEVLVVLASGHGVRFDAEGTCLSSIYLGAGVRSNALAFSAGVISYLVAYPEQYYVKQIDLEGQWIQNLGSSGSQARLVTRVQSGGLLAGHGGRLFLNTTGSGNIAVLENDGSQSVLDVEPDYFRGSTDDLPGGNATSSAARDFPARHSLVTQLSWIGDGLVFLGLYNGFETRPERRAGIHVVAVDGTPLTRSPVLLDPTPYTAVGTGPGLLLLGLGDSLPDQPALLVYQLK